MFLNQVLVDSSLENLRANQFEIFWLFFRGHETSFIMMVDWIIKPFCRQYRSTLFDKFEACLSSCHHQCHHQIIYFVQSGGVHPPVVWLQIKRFSESQILVIAAHREECDNNVLPDTSELLMLEYGCVIHNPDLCSFQSPKDLDMPQRKSSRLRRARRLLTIKSKLVKAPAIKINTVGRGNPLFTLPLAVTSSCPSLIFKRYLQF